MAILRGIENGFAVVRVARQALVTASDAQGRIVSVATSSGAGPVILVTSVSPVPGTTIYGRIGDFFPRVCAIASLALLIAILSQPVLVRRRVAR